MNKLKALTAALLLFSPCGLKAAPSAAIHYFDHTYRLSFDLSNEVEKIAASSGTIRLNKVANTVTYTNGAKFVINAPGSLSAAELNRTTDYAHESDVEILEGGSSLLLPPRGLFETFAAAFQDDRIVDFSVERLPAQILAGTSPSGLKFRVLYVPSRREKRLWEPTFKVEHRLSVEGHDAVFASFAVPMGLNGLSQAALKEASRKSTDVLLSLGAGGAIEGDVIKRGPERILTYLTEARTDIAALDQNDLGNFWRWSDGGALKISTSAPEFICSNITVSDPELAKIIKPYALRKIAGTTVAFIALVPSNSALLAGLAGSPFTVWSAENETALSALISELRIKQKARVIVAVSFLWREESGYLMSASGIDALIGAKSWDTASARKTRVELTKWLKEKHTRPAITIFPDSSGSGKINLELGRQGELTAIEALPQEEDGAEPFYYQENTWVKERIVNQVLGSGDALLPDPKRLSLRGNKPNGAYAIPDFYNMAAWLVRRKLKAEVSILKIKPSGNNVLGDVPSSMAKTWLGPDEPVEFGWLPGSFLRKFLRKLPRPPTPLDYYSDRFYQGKDYYAMSGIDADGRVAGLPLRDAELYLTALPASLLDEKVVFKKRRSRGATLYATVIGGLQALKDEAPTREAWEKAIAAAALNATESRSIWRINLRNLSLQAVNTSVSAPAGYTGVNESRLNTVDQTRIQGSGKLFSEFHDGKFRFDSGVSADYGKLALRPHGQPRVTVESVDQLIFENEVRYRLKTYNGALGPLVIGPFATAAYDTEFSRTEPSPLRKILRGKTGFKMFEGAYLQEFYAGLTTEQIYTYAPARTQYAAETGFRLAWPVPGTALTLNADGTYRNFARSRFDTVYDLKERLELNLKVSTRLYGDITINPFASFFLASGKKLPGSATNLTTGFTLEYSKLFKLKR